MKIPPKYLKTTGHSTTVFFCDYPINLTILAVELKVDKTQLSRVFSGQRQLSLPLAIKLANAFGMGLDAFIYAFTKKVRRTA